MHTRKILVTKSNNLIEASYYFTIWESRVFICLISDIYRGDINFKSYQIKYLEAMLKSIYKVKQSDIKNAIEGLMKKQIKIKQTKGDELLCNILLKSKSEGIQLHTDLSPYLLRITSNYTYYDLKNITKLNAEAIRIYELLKQYQHLKKRTIEVEYLIGLLGLSNKHKAFTSFSRSVLNPAIRQINRYTDLGISDFNRIYKGRKVTTLVFRFSIKKEGRNVSEKMFT